jgi:RNA 2',3'-cyclic 3'-phosphodiesterase
MADPTEKTMSRRDRCFIAVCFSDELKLNLSQLQEKLKQKLQNPTSVKWADPGNIHLTLQFLGEIDSGLVPKITDGLHGAFGDIHPFTATLAGVGAFPSIHRPRVLWTAIRTGADGMKSLQSCVLRVTEPLGFPREDRPFSPHVTLGRLKDGRGFDFSAPEREFREVSVGTCQIDRVTLQKSELRPAGPIYSIVDSFPLGR